MVRRRGRRERRHPPRAAAVRHDPDQRRDRPPRPLRHRWRRSWQSFDQYLAQVPGPKVRVRRRPGRARAGGAPRRRSRTGLAEGVAVRAVDVRPERGRVPVRRSSATGSRSASVSLPLRGVHNVRQRHRRDGDGDGARRRLRGRGRRARQVRRRRPAVRHPRRRRRRDASSTTTPTCRPRSPPCSRAARDSGDGWQRVIAVFQPNRYNRMA